MLVINKSGEVKTEYIESDNYIPLNIEFGSWDILEETSIYWRAGNFKSSLIEFGFGKEGKDLRSITLVLCNKVYYMNSKEISLENIEWGCPKVNLECKEDCSIIDEKIDFKVFSGVEGTYILFSEEKTDICVRNEQVLFCMNANSELVGVYIKNVDLKPSKK